MDINFIDNNVGVLDKVMSAKILNNRFYLPTPLEPIISNNPKASLKEYDNPNDYTSGLINNSPRTINTLNNLSDIPISLKSSENSSEVINILQGKKEGSLESLATAY